MKDLRVLVVSEKYWPDGDGGELATNLIVNILSKEHESLQSRRINKARVFDYTSFKSHLKLVIERLKYL